MIYTIGHSTRTAGEFISLANQRFKILIDVRSHPNSRQPYWQIENLKEWVPARGAIYVWNPGLGGWTAEHMGHAQNMARFGVDVAIYSGGKFPKQRIAQQSNPEQKIAWTNVGLRDYSFYMSTPEFLEAAQNLMWIGKEHDVAIMCCEAHWWRCHRSMVADYLWYRGVDSYHIMSRGRAKPHSEVIGNRLERYEPYVLSAWNHY